MTSYRDIGRDFEFEFDLGSLYEYETPLATSLVKPKVDFVSCDRFGPGSAAIPAALNDVLKRIAHLLVASPRIGMGITEVELRGCVDTTGRDTLSGKDLGKMRAEAVRDKIVKLTKEVGRGTVPKVSFIILSNATVPIETKDQALNRRVVVRLPRSCQVFFAEYDLLSFPFPIIGFNSHPNVTDKQGRLNSVTFVKQELDARLKKRAEMALAGKIMPPQPAQLSGADFETIRKAVVDLSAVQLTLFGKYHPGIGGFAPDSLMSCFLKFANGELRSPHPEFDSGDNAGRSIFGVGEPDSNQVFMFAEFAFLCLEWDLRPLAPLSTVWARALPALIAAQEVFMHVYRENPRSPPPPVNAPLPVVPPNATLTATHQLRKFAAKNFKSIGGSQTKGEGQSSAARLAELTSKYSKPMGVEPLRAAMTSNLLRAQMLT